MPETPGPIFGFVRQAVPNPTIVPRMIRFEQNGQSAAKTDQPTASLAGV